MAGIVLSPNSFERVSAAVRRVERMDLAAPASQSEGAEGLIYAMYAAPLPGLVADGGASGYVRATPCYADGSLIAGADDVAVRCPPDLAGNMAYPSGTVLRVLPVAGLPDVTWGENEYSCLGYVLAPHAAAGNRVTYDAETRVLSYGGMANDPGGEPAGVGVSLTVPTGTDSKVYLKFYNGSWSLSLDSGTSGAAYRLVAEIKTDGSGALLSLRSYGAIQILDVVGLTRTIAIPGAGTMYLANGRIVRYET